MKKADIFGDSIMRGMYIDETSGKRKLWKNDYLAKINEQSSVQIKNHALIGSTVTRGRQIFDRSVERGLQCDYLLLEYGGNDSDYLWEEIAAAPMQEHLCKTPLPQFERAYAALIEKGLELNMQPVLMTLPPVDAQRYFNWFSRELDQQALMRWLGDVNVIYRHQEAYSLATARLALRYCCPLIDLRGVFLLRDDFNELISCDGLHPTAQGYSLIWDAISKFFVNFN